MCCVCVCLSVWEAEPRPLQAVRSYSAKLCGPWSHRYLLYLLFIIFLLLFLFKKTKAKRRMHWFSKRKDMTRSWKDVLHSPPVCGKVFFLFRLGKVETGEWFHLDNQSFSGRVRKVLFMFFFLGCCCLKARVSCVCYWGCFLSFGVGLLISRAPGISSVRARFFFSRWKSSLSFHLYLGFLASTRHERRSLWFVFRGGPFF